MGSRTGSTSFRKRSRLIAFDFYIDAEGRNMTVVSVHPDADSLTYHLEVGVLPLAGSPI